MFSISVPPLAVCIRSPGDREWLSLCGDSNNSRKTVLLIVLLQLLLIKDLLRTVEGKATATHPSALAWKIPWTEEPGGLLSMGLHRVGHD